METFEIEIDTVAIVPDHEEVYRIIEMKLSNDILIESSPHHPFYVVGKGWSVYNVEMAKADLNFDVFQLEVGDILLFYNGNDLKETELIEMKDTGKYAPMYNLKYVRKNNTFFANGILVHNRY